MMTQETFAGLVGSFRGMAGKPHLLFNFAGEPTLNQLLPEFVAHAGQNGHRTLVSTNATVLDDQLSHRLILAGLSQLDLCLDGFSKRSQESFRVGSDFHVVKRNIERFLAIRHQSGAPLPTVNVQTLLTSFSEGEREDILKWAQGVGVDAVKFKTLNLFGSHPDAEQIRRFEYLLPVSPALRRKQSEIRKSLCTVSLYQAVVFWDGRLGLCCMDYDGFAPMSATKPGGFMQAFTSHQSVASRRKGFLRRFPMCKKCALVDADLVRDLVATR
jgi:MoaA/NifB/PqqE/SkfB family radical SAM enzyme